MTAACKRTRNPAAQLWVLSSQLQRAAGLDRDEAEDILRGYVRDVSGQTSTKKLSQAERHKVSQFLQDAIRRAGGTPRVRPAKGTTVTRAQSKALMDLARALGWDRATLQRWLRGWMQRLTGKAPWPQTREEARDCHEGLEAQLWRSEQYSSARVRARASELLEQGQGLTDWERGFLHDLVRRDGDLGQRSTTPNRGGRGETRGRWKQACILAEIEEMRGQGVPR